MELTGDSLVFLSAVDTLSGSATTPELRVETGLSKNKIHYQYQKLEDEGFIEVSYADSGVGNRIPPKVATLTTEGVEALQEEKRNFEDSEGGPYLEPEKVVLSRSEFVEFQEENEELQRRLNVLEQKQSELLEFEKSAIDLLQRRYDYLNELNKRVIALSEWRNDVNHYLLACELAFNKINFDFGKALDVVSEDYNYTDDGLKALYQKD